MSRRLSLGYDGALKFCRCTQYRLSAVAGQKNVANIRRQTGSFSQNPWRFQTPTLIQYHDSMAKENTDRTTIDLFADERRPGRPKTNPLTRDEQLRINKRNQLKRDKVRGLRRVELKMNSDAVDALNQLAEERNMSRSELIEEMILLQLNATAL